MIGTKQTAELYISTTVSDLSQCHTGRPLNNVCASAMCNDDRPWPG